jgi:acyl CoA:acetate/3-ketoacid CoA transferase alpha subunit
LRGDERIECCLLMIDKIVQTTAEALAGIRDGATVLLGGFGSIGQPNALIDGLIEQGASDLTIVANNAGTGHTGLARLLELGRVRKIICSYPRSANSVVFEEVYRAGKLELELVPQGTMAERLRAAGAGIPGDRGRHHACHRQGGARDRRPRLHSRTGFARRRGVDRSMAGRPLG